MGSNASYEEHATNEIISFFSSLEEPMDNYA